MDNVFSVDHMSDDVWSPPPIDSSSSTQTQPLPRPSSSSKMMNRSSSEWAFQRFFRETSVSDSSSSEPPPTAPSPPFSTSKHLQNDVVEIKYYNDENPKPKSPVVPIDSEEYQAFLKSRLNLACAAVALTRASYMNPSDSASAPDNGSKASSVSHIESHLAAKASAFESSKGRDMEAGGPLVIPSVPPTQKESGIQVRSTSGSSREQSDDEEVEGEMEMTQKRDPAAAKRVRRMLSNRESARRSRRRKQTHLTDLETQVAQLRVENSTLLKRLTGITERYGEAAVDNRVLKAGIETLRAKVKMAEETVKRVTGFNPLFQSMSDISSMHMPSSFAGSPSDSSTDAAVPVSDDPKQHLYQPPPKNHMSPHESGTHNGFTDSPSTDNAQQNPSAAVSCENKISRTASMQRVASLEHLQKRICGGVADSSCGE